MRPKLTSQTGQIEVIVYCTQQGGENACRELSDDGYIPLLIDLPHTGLSSVTTGALTERGKDDRNAAGICG